ncbi:hypothetical protein [Pleionea sp. CnH1-48]|uniref:hypothetical protein n=1 Tax=Pleionea sp. CnH1-48 TaxID=2954494 RepID=UPI002096E29A|nr:hypothetical protein [Pleionea sp. CnH1-48]MCO7223793.1 hypothetical protein [Pleionea sp. CnH1-48]
MFLEKQTMVHGYGISLCFSHGITGTVKLSMFHLLISSLLVVISSSIVALIYDQASPYIALVFIPLFFANYKIKSQNLTIFQDAFSFLLFVYSIALAYSIGVFQEPIVGKSDEWTFFELSSKSYYRDMSIPQLLLGIINAPLAVKIWGVFYAVAESYGIKPNPWIGIYVNIFFVALSIRYIVNTVELLFPENSNKKKLATLLCLFNGMFWLFATLHMRDSFLLFIICYFVYRIILYIEGKSSVFPLVAVTAVFVIVMPFLRYKLLFVPVLFLGLIYVSKIKHLKGFHVLSMGVVLGSVFVVAHVTGILKLTLSIFDFANQSYSQLAANESSGGLATAAIISQPFFIRWPLGFVYQHVSPLPFWVSMYFGATPYHWFKGLYGIVALFLTPYAFISIKYCIQSYFSRSCNIKQSMRFVILSYFLTFSAVAITSLETRHVGQFYLLFLSAALFSINKSRTRLDQLIMYSYWLFLTSIYLLWAANKLLS